MAYALSWSRQRARTPPRSRNASRRQRDTPTFEADASGRRMVDAQAAEAGAAVMATGTTDPTRITRSFMGAVEHRLTKPKSDPPNAGTLPRSRQSETH